MMTRTRRFSVALFAIVTAALLLHRQCAEVLVARGDGELAAGHPQRARVLYRRAFWFDAHSATVSERLTFSDLESGGIDDLREGMRVSAEALHANPQDAALWTDRALCASRLGDDRTAEEAFYRAGQLTHDGKLLYLSALSARRLGENVDIRMYESHRAGAGKRA